jgi:hypothetical protein
VRTRGRVVVPAPVRRRVGAGLIDLVLLGSGAALAIGAFVGIAVWRGRGEDPDLDEEGGASTVRAPLFTPAARIGIQGVGAGIAVLCRNARSPGARIMHLRRADVRTGGPVTVRSAFIGAVVDQVMRSATRVFQPSLEPAGKEAFWGEHRGLKRGGLALLPSMAVSLGPALIAPRHQTLAERLSGVVVIDDR